jgi:MOSC domain-containing protein YiiM
VRKLNLEGDGQADLSVHGGPDKAVYLYPAEHYPYWQTELVRDVPWGMFGENLTTNGLVEDGVNIGDRFRIGATELVVTQPRMPCFKLGIRFERPDIVKRFLASGRTGWYVSVAEEGDVAAGDEMERIDTDERGLTVADVAGLFVGEGGEETLQQAVDHDGLPDGWRDYFRQRIA